MKHNIDHILEKYWDGTSSTEEEAILNVYFAKGDIAEDHRPYADLFGYFADQRTIKYPVDKSAISPSSRLRIVQIRRWFFGVAAIFVLGLATIFVMQQLNDANVTEPTSASVIVIEDPEEALKVTKEALALVSTKFRESQQSVRQNLVALEKASIFK